MAPMVKEAIKAIPLNKDNPTKFTIRTYTVDEWDI